MLYQYTCCTNSGLDNPPVVGESCVCSDEKPLLGGDNGGTPQYQLVGPPARCNEVDMFMPTTKESCYAAAGQMSRGVRDYTGEEGEHGQTGPLCAVDARNGDQRVRWNGQGGVTSEWGGNSLGWRAVCVTNGAAMSGTPGDHRFSGAEFRSSDCSGPPVRTWYVPSFPFDEASAEGTCFTDDGSWSVNNEWCDDSGGQMR